VDAIFVCTRNTNKKRRKEIVERINLANVEERSFEALPAGRYVVEFTDFEWRETKDSPENKLPGGTPFVNWELTVQRDAKTGDEKYKNRKLWTNTIIHEKVLFNLKGLLRAIGWTDEQLNNPEGIDFQPETIIGSTCIAVVAVRPYNGDDTNDVKRFAALDSEAPAEAGSLLP
jgi:hypothetical protein